MSKILKITMILVMTFFTVFMTPQERAHANPLAVGGALYLGGAGVYVLGAVGIGAIAGIVGCSSCQEDIEAHASRTWAGSTQIVKDGLQLMVDASVGAWGATSSALTAVDSNVNTWVDGQIDGIANAAMNSKYTYDPVTVNTGNYALGFMSSSMKSATVKSAHVGIYGFSYKGMMYKEIQVGKNNAQMVVNMNYAVPSNATVQPIVIPNSNPLYTKFAADWASASSPELILNLAKAMSVSFGYGLISNFQTDYANVKANATETWEEMTDAGLVLPTDNARPMNGDIPLTYDPVTDTYAGIDGITVPHDKVTGFEYQKPHWKTLEDLAMLGLSGLGAGLYIDGWAGSDFVTSTYDPATDITTDSVTTTTTTTNVTTGETATSATTTTSTTTGDTTSNNTPTPEGQTPKTQSGKANRWGKLVTTKFPFSLPWDLFFILSFMNADPVSPVFEVDERILKRENVEGIQIKFAIDLSFLDPYVPWFRRLILLGFAFFLVMNTRKLLGGAQ